MGRRGVVQKRHAEILGLAGRSAGGRQFWLRGFTSPAVHVAGRTGW